MEGKRGYCGFFFAYSYQRFSTLYRIIGKRFGELFEGNGENKERTPKDNFQAIIQTRKDEQFVNNIRIADESGLSTEAFNRLTLYEYYLLIENILKRAEQDKIE